MPQHQTESMTGVIDGANTTFFTTAPAGGATPYVAGSVAVWVNGQLQMHHLGNPWSETDPATGEVTLGFAPQAGDTVVASYYDTSPILPETEIEELEGTLLATDDLTGSLSESVELDGFLGEEDALAGAIIVEESLSGTLDDTDYLEGELVVCE